MSESILRVGPWQIDPDELIVSDGTRRAALQQKTMDLLTALHGANGRLVSKDQLSSQVWGEEGASDELIARHISMIRQALGDSARNPRYLETVPKRGYRLLHATDQATRTAPGKWAAKILKAAIAVAVILAAGQWMLQTPDPPRLLESARPLFSPGPYRADITSFPGSSQIAYIEGPNVDLAGSLVWHDRLTGDSATLSDGLNRFPAFSPGGRWLAVFRDEGGCQLLVWNLAEKAIHHQSPCQGQVSSPPAWSSPSQLWYALDGGGSESSKLMSQEVGQPLPKLLWSLPQGQQLRFPVASTNNIYALIRSATADALVQLSSDGSGASQIFSDPEKPIRWLSPGKDSRLLLVQYDGVDRFALYEMGLETGDIRLIGNRDSAQSAAYAPGHDGVLYTATRYRRRHQAYLRGSDGLMHRAVLDIRDPSVAYTEVSPVGDAVVFVSNPGNGFELNRMDLPRGEIRQLLVRDDPTSRIGFPAWFPDGSRIALAAGLPPELLIIDSQTGEVLQNKSMSFMPGPMTPSSDGRRLYLIERGSGKVKVSSYDLSTDTLTPLREENAQWAQVSPDGQRLYLVDNSFRLIAQSMNSGEIEPIEYVGSASGWRVIGDTAFYACPGEPTTSAMLCEMNLVSRQVIPHPEVMFYPAQLSSSMDRSVLTAPELEHLSVELMSAPWSDTAAPTR